MRFLLTEIAVLIRLRMLANKLAVLGIMLGYEKVISTSAEYVQKLHEVTERICKEKIGSFV